MVEGGEKMITLYSNGCPMCNRLETMLINADVGYNKVSALSKIMDTASTVGISSLPFIEHGGNYMTFSEAMQFINEQ